MQANFITSRAICQDKFFEQEQKRQYKQHKKKIVDIHHHKSNPFL